MNIIFYTSGTAGSGRLVRGIAVGNALKRNSVKCNFTILNSSPFAHLADLFNINHVEIAAEDDASLSEKNYKNSDLYKEIIKLNPDIIIVDLLWFSLHNFINDLKCIKIFICHQVINDFFKIKLSNSEMNFDPGQYNRLLAIEPFKNNYNFENINPVILRNKNEIFSREDAREKLGLKGSDKKNALFAVNARPGDFERIKKKYSYLEDVGYNVIYSSNYSGGLFPVVDYFNAIDYIICLAGYGQFYECLYFNKEAVFEVIPLNFSSMNKRIMECSKLEIEKNGADDLCKIIMEYA